MIQIFSSHTFYTYPNYSKVLLQMSLLSDVELVSLISMVSFIGVPLVELLAQVSWKPGETTLVTKGDYCT